MSNKKVAVLFAVSLASGCFFPQAQGFDSLEARCAQGIAMFESSRCSNAIPTASDRYTVQAEFDQISLECSDPKSKEKLSKLSVCVDGYKAAMQAQRDENSEIRRKYKAHVESLKADPAYTPALEAVLLARDEVSVAHDQWVTAGQKSVSSPYYGVYESKKKHLEEANKKMMDLFEKHGVDAKYAEVLGLW